MVVQEIMIVHSLLAGATNFVDVESISHSLSVVSCRHVHDMLVQNSFLKQEFGFHTGVHGFVVCTMP